MTISNSKASASPVSSEEKAHKVLRVEGMFALLEIAPHKAKWVILSAS